EIDWTTVRPWLYGIARGVLANRWRSRHRRQRLLARIAGAAPLENSGEVVVRAADDHQAIVALEQLRPNDREILMLAAWEDMTGPEIAQALGISRNAAEQRLHRAKTRYARVFGANPALTRGGLRTGGGSR
ncbi:MAG TPA: sigma-70 family RNA polymerase sigma factor, partial [Acidimicrobiia bacterium]|nr:sigma-70 family RNA polymerase sigma factor [Acidimicrobiia bacterium]